MLKVVCFKWGYKGGFRLPSLNVIGAYSAWHVNNLYKAITKYLTIPHEFICITDDPEGVECKTIPLWDKCMEYGGCYNRLYVFSKDMKELIGDRFVCIDLDVSVISNLDSLFSRTEPLILNKFYGNNPNQFYNGGLFMMDAGAYDRVWTEFEKDIPGNIRILQGLNKVKKVLGTDQAWISHILGRGIPMFLDTEGVLAYRRLTDKGRGKVLPPNAKMVFFAGTNDPTIAMDRNDWIIDHCNGNHKKFNTCDFEELLRGIKHETLNMGKNLGYFPNILNPTTLSEKLKWRKFFRRTELMTEVADKVLVYNYIETKLGHRDILIPLLQSTTNPEELKFEEFPDRFVVKPNHLSGQLLFLEKGKFNKAQVIQQCRAWLSKVYGQDKNEWPYSKIKPQILVQEFVGDDEPAIDYKFSIMNGKCTWIEIYSDRYNGRGLKPKLAFYTPTWKRLTAHSKGYQPSPEIDKPKQLKEMIKIAEKLAEPFDYIRVDLYLVNNKIYFGELTHFPHSGNFNFIPVSFDYEMGEKLNLTFNG